MIKEGNRLWEEILDEIGQKIDHKSFNLWIKPLKFNSFSQDKLIVKAPNQFIKERVEEKYLPLLQLILNKLTGEDAKIELDIASEANSFLIKKSNQATPVYNNTYHSRLNPRYNFETFVVGNNNRLAHAAALAVAQSPSAIYNPLFIYGDVGLGKTHLLQAIAHFILKNRPELTFNYLSSEQFTNELINAIRDDKTAEFRKKHRSADILLVDDIHFLAGKERTQEEFFHTFNALYEAHKQIVLSSDRPPTDIPTLEKRLRSRFEWGLITDIQPPDLETRIAILKKKAEVENIPLSDEVANFIAERVKTNIRKLEGCLMRLIAYSSLYNIEINVASAKDILKDIIFPKESKLITPEGIQQSVAKYYKLKETQLRGKKRVKSIALPRQVAMYLCRELTDCSFPEIGEKFGGKDHTTVMHAWRKIKEQRKKDKNLNREIEEIIQRITS
ncbi:chromosomal replication initiator protein DnaA [Candidatus Aerophobetes bacterium]|nr:chromosomal replication initiator protein DnaA [Candidatus Aerophobetes bacterium]